MKVVKMLFKSLFALSVTLWLVSCGGGGSGSNSGKIEMGGAIQGRQLSLTGTVTTIAGAAGLADGTAAEASFSYPTGITSDGANLYVADSSNNAIRKVVISTGVVTTLAGVPGPDGSANGTGTAARFAWPRDIATDGIYLYVSDYRNNTIRKIVIATGSVTTLAGTAGVSGFADGAGSSAEFSGPSGIVTDGTNLYVSDMGNNTIRKIVISTGIVTTLAGSAGGIGATDGAGTSARFDSPTGITISGMNLYVSDSLNRTIRKIVISTGAVTTLAGTARFTGSADGIGSAAKFYGPSGINTDGTNLYVADYGNTVRKIVISTGAVTTLAGTAWVGGSADGIGPAASFSMPRGITSDGTSLYVTESGNNTIRKIVISSGAVTTLAGAPGLTDGIGTAARFSSPIGMTTDGTNLFVTDEANSTIRKIVISTGTVTTFAGSAGLIGSTDGIGAAATFRYPAGITTDGKNLYVADTGNYIIRKIEISTGTVSTLAGTANVFGSADGIGTAASFAHPTGITTDGANLFVVDYGSCTIRKIVISTGEVSTLAGTANVYGSADGTGAAASFSGPLGITTDGTNLYVTDSFNNSIRKIVISTGAVTTMAGTAGAAGTADGAGAAAGFSAPSGITTDGTNLFVTDNGSNTIRKIVISTGAVTTLAGTAGVAGSAEGAGAAAGFSGPAGITTDGTSLYVADSKNHTIRIIH